MDLGLDEQQELLKNFARDFLEKECPETLVREMEEDEKGYSPSLMEIGRNFGLSSVATVHKHVENLKKKGFVQKVWNANRSLDLTEKALSLRDRCRCFLLTA